MDEKLNNSKLQSRIITAFALAIVGFVVCFFISFAGIIISAIALGLLKGSDEENSQPYKTFRLIALPVSIVGLILSILITIVLGSVMFIVGLYWLVCIALYVICFGFFMLMLIIYIMYMILAAGSGSIVYLFLI